MNELSKFTKISSNMNINLVRPEGLINTLLIDFKSLQKLHDNERDMDMITQRREGLDRNQSWRISGYLLSRQMHEYRLDVISIERRLPANPKCTVAEMTDNPVKLPF